MSRVIGYDYSLSEFLQQTKANAVIRTIYVSNLNHEITDKILEDLFGQFGQLHHVELRHTPHYDFKVTINAFVAYYETESAKRCLECNIPLSHNGRQLYIQPAFPINQPVDIPDKETLYRQHEIADYYLEKIHQFPPLNATREDQNSLYNTIPLSRWVLLSPFPETKFTVYHNRNYGPINTAVGYNQKPLTLQSQQSQPFSQEIRQEQHNEVDIAVPHSSNFCVSSPKDNSDINQHTNQFGITDTLEVERLSPILTDAVSTSLRMHVNEMEQEPQNNRLQSPILSNAACALIPMPLRERNQQPKYPNRKSKKLVNNSEDSKNRKKPSILSNSHISRRDKKVNNKTLKLKISSENTKPRNRTSIISAVLPRDHQQHHNPNRRSSNNSNTGLTETTDFRRNSRCH